MVSVTVTNLAKEAEPRRPSTARNEGWREAHPSRGCSVLGVFMPGCLIRAASWLQTFGGNIWEKIAEFKTALTDTQPWQPRSLSKIRTHAGRPCQTHQHTYNARQRRKKSPQSRGALSYGRRDKCRTTAAADGLLGRESSVTYVCILSFLVGREKECVALQPTHKTRPRIARTSV